MSLEKTLGGNGLGLSIVRTILEKHSSEYGVINTEIGIKFKFDLDK